MFQKRKGKRDRVKAMHSIEGEGSDGALNKLPLVFDLDEKEEEIVNHFTSLVSNVCLTLEYALTY